MKGKLQYQTVNATLKSILKRLMKEEVFSPFRLVGGTALSLRLGHRKSLDVDLFTDAEYGSVDFTRIEIILREKFDYVDSLDAPVALGKSYFVGITESKSIKLDLFYTEPFIRAAVETDGIRFASTDDIVAMKVDVIRRGARKKDFWDIHELLDRYTLKDMLLLRKERYPYSHDKDEIIASFTHFENADDDFDPICLKGKYWELIKLDITEALKG